MLESLFNKVAGLRLNIAKTARAPNLKNIYELVLL